MPAGVSNPLSIPGGWNKEQQKQGFLDQQQSDDAQALVPRGAQGIINESGEVVDNSGKAIARLTDTSNPGELVGKTVNEAGNVVNDTGDILSKTLPLGDDSSDHDNNSEYTTESNKKPGSGLQDTVGGAGKAATDTVEGVTDTVGNTVGGAVGGVTGGLTGDKDDSAEKQPQQEGQDTPQVNLEDRDPSTDDKDQETPAVDDSARSEKQLDTQEKQDSFEDQKQATTDDVQKASEDENAPEKDIPGDKDASGEDIPEDQKDVAEDLKDKEVTQDQKEVPEDVKDKELPEGEKELPEGEKELPEGERELPEGERELLDKDTPEEQKDIPQSVAPPSEAPPSEAPPPEAPASEAPPSEIPKSEIPEGVEEDEVNKPEEIEEDEANKPEVIEEDDVKKPEGEEAELLASLENAKVNKSGNLVDDDGDIVGRLVEGDPKKLLGKRCDEDGKIRNDAGKVIGRGEPLPKEEEAPQGDEALLPTIENAKVNKAGNLVDEDGDVVGRLVDGDPKQLVGKRCDENGNIRNDAGKVIGRGEPLPKEEEEEPQGDEALLPTLENAKVNKAGDLIDEDGDVVGRLVEGDATKLLGRRCDENGHIRNDAGKIIGRGEPLPEEKEEGLDYSILKGSKVNKSGNLVNKDGDIVGRVAEGELQQLLGKRCDENGDIWDESGKVIGRGEPVPDSEREGGKKFAPFENFPGATVEADGSVVFEGKRVGTVIEGDPKHLKGSQVDEDGDILDRRGNAVGKAEPWDEPEPEAEPEPEVIDRSSLAGKRVNKAGNVVDRSGEIYGRVIEGNVSNMIGRMCDKEGNIRSESGDIIGKAELVSEGEREGLKEGPFAELKGCTVNKEGKVVTPAGDVVGRLVNGDPKILAGRAVDEDGEVLDRNGNSIGKAERWEEPEVEKKKNPLSGRKVNREGTVVDEEGNIVGKLTSGDLSICSGKEIDDDGDVLNQKGQSIGHVNLLEDIPAEPEEEPEPEPEESEEAKQQRLEYEKDVKLAGQLAACIEQSLEKIKPICRMISEKIERAERTPKEELDEEELVKQVRPLIEEGGKILTETNGVIRGLDPDGRIQRNAKSKAGTREASPEEHHLAEVLKELTGTVTQTIDSAKSKIADMPHAKKELNPLWGLLAEPLGQILAAVGLLLSGVLGLVGRLLSGLGLGGLLDGLLGSLGLDRVLKGLGLGQVVNSLTGKKK